ncbi:DegT/DnrJ/EryC1/StrS family aminotransferase [Roseburia inulinivorans]|uniref:UDP-4-amino-4-deoxy-L-arabinose--oxoglutarate aminotransferase n=1 Tax=Roseburia inulinivorans TaxID=360807 RepID=A0A173XN28_9FIRM|nr:DegT/DnrJ/EryC1/StrS family aminotransferase [Roseburia inulinivorans]CUN52650.1 UDP-4-amino-4-deoxy-L-arabinose--oxoglutarate aminotransferase [Roseburia inulinivorans]
MEFRDLRKQYVALKDEIDSGIQEVINATAFISGSQVETLEKELAEYVGVKHCVTCANGTDALSMALMAWNLKAGECAFVPDFTFFASGETVSFEGATPIFVDVDERTYNMDPVKLETAIQKVLVEGKLIPRVIVAVDLFGLPADYDMIRPIADKYGLKILEDGAQGFGGEIDGKKACSFGDISTTSFFPAKPLGCYGDGGAIFTNDDDVDAYLRSIRVHGKGSFKYDNVRIGWNSRLDTIQAAILLPKLHAFMDYERDNVNKVAAKYTEGLKELVVTPEFDTKYTSSWAQYCIQLKSEEERESLQAYLKEQGIPTMIYYPKPMHKQDAFADLQCGDEDYAVTNKLCKTVLELPMHPYMEDADIEKIVNMIAACLKENRY